ncbi:E3 ubiquitin-protein ligase TRIM39 isoform X17 [Carassius gibelio]|uniref:E3 ubiquitin-protein ligase TRIM39 isoform X17 n=1 Tax=Carassius gibelio TaxID=101364 RepID=UPI002278467B|nr:E3 ubiquitin-protein ligase TRIM39 isoform X17 [Carassius gibelio]
MNFTRTAVMSSSLRQLVLLLWTSSYCTRCASVPQSCVQCSLSCDEAPVLKKHESVIISIIPPLLTDSDRVYNVSSLCDGERCSVQGCFQRDSLYTLEIYTFGDETMSEKLVDEPNLQPDCSPKSRPVRKYPNSADGKLCNELLISLAICFLIVFLAVVQYKTKFIVYITERLPCKGKAMAESSPSNEPGKTRRTNINYPPLMSSSSGSLSEELQCSICLDVFTDPVSTPCGHNFCKICLNEHWDNSQIYSCPYCKYTFKQRPDLKINTTLREIADPYKKKPPEKTTEVLCDICEERKLKALKSCLVCQSSYCETHLEPHLRVTRLKKHKLMDPVSNLEDYICQKHERPLDLFCRDDQTIICLSCTDGDHKNHNTVSLEETELMIQDTQQMIQDRIKKIEDIKHSAEVRHRSTQKDKTACIELFTDLIRSIERHQTEQLEMMEEKQKAAEKQKKELIEELEQVITELKMRNIKLQQLSQTEDVIQIYSSLSSLRNTRNWPEISVNTRENLESLMRDLTQLKDTIDEKLDQTKLKWMQQYAVDVTLNPDTAHPFLILSDDGKQVRDGGIDQKLRDKPERFDYGVCVLGKEGFSAGRFYFEVQVKGKTNWDLGVVRESINRKGQITLKPSDGHWTVALRNGDEYKACAGPSVSLSLRVKPQRVGVFVDYEEGLVSFYDAESRSHIYSFTAQSFTGKLYPYFSPYLNEGGKNSLPLIITPVTKEH